MGTLQYSQVRPAVAQSDLATIAPYLFWLMFRNIASDGFVFEDPLNTGVLSHPGCVLAVAGRLRMTCRKPPSIASAIAFRVLPGWSYETGRMMDRVIEAGSRPIPVQKRSSIALRRTASSMSPPGIFHRPACSATTRSVSAERPPISIVG